MSVGVMKDKYCDEVSQQSSSVYLQQNKKGRRPRVKNVTLKTMNSKKSRSKQSRDFFFLKFARNISHRNGDAGTTVDVPQAGV
jgi:hypothetical protein